MTNRQTAYDLKPADVCADTFRTRLIGLLLMLAMIISWSSGFIGYRYAAEQGGVYLATFWRFVLAAFVLLPFAIKELRRLCWGDLLHHGLMGVFAIAGYIAPIARSIELGVAPGTSSVIVNLLPVTIVLLAGFVPGQRTQGWQWLGLLLCVMGMLIASASSIEFGTASAWAYSLPLLAVLSLACATLYEKRATVVRISGLTALFIQVCSAVPVFAGLALYEGGLRPVATVGFGLGVVWLTVFSTLAGWGFYWLCLQRFSLQRISGALFLTPPLTMVWAWLQFGDSVLGSTLAGVSLTLIGLPLLVRRT
ncbi:MAG TPA: DMT family transporter [Pseudomonas sp.]|uniref:DMT family transporter n=1 Tax=Pseudomonas sp. TaxID=306 RepID=UPI002ED9CD2A